MTTRARSDGCSVDEYTRLSLAKHLTAERKTDEVVAGKGVAVKWERLRRQNHWFDARYNTCAAGHLYGERLVDEPKPQPRPRKTLAQLMRADGTPWIDNARWQEGWQRLMGR